jgi:hypothetical protein
MLIQPMSLSVAGLAEELVLTLGEVVKVSAGLRDPWWIIGSAALALTGLPGVVVPDVDLVTSRRDAERLIRRWADSAEPPPAVPSTKFRSEFRRFRHAPLPLEVMGDFDVWTGAEWHPIQPRTRVRVACGAGAVYVAAADEQVEILRRIGRPKDLARAKALEAYRRSTATVAAPTLLCPTAVAQVVATPAGADWPGRSLAVSELLGMPMCDGACLLSA